jgi:hypothetical protein
MEDVGGCGRLIAEAATPPPLPLAPGRARPFFLALTLDFLLPCGMAIVQGCRRLHCYRTCNSPVKQCKDKRSAKIHMTLSPYPYCSRLNRASCLYRLQATGTIATGVSEQKKRLRAKLPVIARQHVCIRCITCILFRRTGRINESLSAMMRKLRGKIAQLLLYLEGYPVGENHMILCRSMTRKNFRA